MRRRTTWPIHAALLVISALMLLPLYWVLKTSVTGENIFDYPPSFWPKNPNLFFFVDVWYFIPFVEYFLNSLIVSLIAVAGNLVFNAMAGYSLTKEFTGKRVVMMLLLSSMMVPFQTTIIPAYLITGRLGLLNTYLGLALPLLSTIICIFVFKASFDAVPRSLIDAARIDGLGELRILRKVMLPLSKAAIATNVILAFIRSWNNFLWPLIITRDEDMQTLPLGLARFLAVHEDTTGALYAFCVMVLAPGIVIFLMAQKEFIHGLTSGATKG
jgi:ABC-type glycerol-3-phosphate transport system permease component